MRQTPSTYVLTLSVDVDKATVRSTLLILDEDAQVMQEDRHEWSSFCYTWLDLAEMLQRRWVAAGGRSNGAVNSPSPHIDMT